ncbi:MAG: hypothetical protein AWU57_2556 [Marinobacter sp. T13-3]|nr:MAG: hypothetical protein AWU57_2556 [Marinobacter sp. T13-3]
MVSHPCSPTVTRPCDSQQCKPSQLQDPTSLSITTNGYPERNCKDNPISCSWAMLSKSQGMLNGLLRMNFRGVVKRDIGIRRLDQQSNFRAPQNHSLGTTPRQ